MGSSCLSETIFAYSARVEAREGEDASDCSTRIIPSAMRAPCRTKSTLSRVMGSRISTASCVSRELRSTSIGQATYLKSSPCTSYAEGKRRTATHMRVVALRQKLNDPGYLCGVLEEQERQTCHSSSTDVVGRIGYCDVQQLTDGSIVRGSSIRKGKSVNAAIAQDGVLFIDR